MPLFHGVGERIRALMLRRGYVRPDGKPDVRRFCLEHGYDKTLFYFWLADRSSPVKEADRLAADLGVTKWYLYSGEGAPTGKRAKPIGGGAGPGDGRPLPALADVLPLIRSWLGRLVQPLLLVRVAA